jgi:transposase
MSQKSSAPAAREPAAPKAPAERVVRDIRRATRKQHSAEEKIRIVLEGLRGEESIAALCRREGIAESLYYSWSKEFLEAGKRRLAGDRDCREFRVWDRTMLLREPSYAATQTAPDPG